MDTLLNILSAFLSTGISWPVIKYGSVFAFGMIFYHYLVRFNPSLLQSIIDKANFTADVATKLVNSIKRKP